MSEMTGWGEALNGEEAAEYLGMNKWSFWQHNERWEIPHIRVAGRKIYVKSQLDVWRAENPTRGLLGRGVSK